VIPGAQSLTGKVLGILWRHGSLICLVLVACLGAVASVLANWPGHFEPDSVWQLAQGRTGVFDDWHPPVMAWILGLCDRILTGARLYIILTTGSFFGALVAFMALRPRPATLSVVLLAVIAASPLALIYQGIVLKDILFADASVAGFAALAWTARMWRHRAARGALIALTVAFFALASLTRQTGIVVAGCGALALGWLAFRSARQHAVAPGPAAFRFGVAAAACLAVVGVLAGVAMGWLELHGNHWPETRAELTAMQIYDLAGAARREPGVRLDVLHEHAPALEVFVRHSAAGAYTPARMDPLRDAPGAPDYLYYGGPAPGAQWRALITSSPWLYLAVRAEVFRWVFLTPDIQQCAPILVGVDADDARQLEDAGLSRRDTDKDDQDSDYAERFLNTPVFSHPFYAVLALVLLAWAVWDLRRGTDEVIAIIAMLVAAFGFTASFLLVGVACDFRYLYFLDVAAMAALAHRVAGWRLPSRRRPPPLDT
jgi:hypothetical protein